jgi:hypothetical protein
MNVLQNKDILYLIFRYFEAEDLCNAAKTCKKWNYVYRTNKFSYIFTGKRFINEKLHLIKNVDVNRKVYIYSSRITDEGIINLYKNNKIKKIEFVNNHGLRDVTDKSIIMLSKTLEVLECMDSANLTDLSLKHLIKNRKIRKLSISGNISDEGFKGLNFVEELYVYSDNVGFFLPYVASNKLKKLSLPNQVISFKGLQISNLTYLSLHGSTIEDEELKYINMENLHTLILCWCKNITDEGIFNLTKKKSFHLRKLCLRSSKITDISLIYLSAIDLDIWGTNISDAGFIYMDKTIKLSIGEMPNITKNCLQHLSHIKYLLAPRTSIEQKFLNHFELTFPHIKCIF